MKLSEYRPVKAVPLAVWTIMLVHLPFAPVMLFTAAMVSPVAVQFALFPPVATLALLGVATVLRIWRIRGFYDALLGAIDRTWNWRHMGWANVLHVVWTTLTVAFLGTGLFSGHIWAMIFALLLTAVSLVLFRGRRKAVFHGNEVVAQQIASAMIDILAPETNFRVPAKTTNYGGKSHTRPAYVDERKRQRQAREAITSVEATKDNGFKVDIRNNGRLTGLNDEQVVGKFADIASALETYDLVPVDEDPRAGHITMKMWFGERLDHTAVARGIPIWDEQGRELPITPQAVPIGVKESGEPLYFGIDQVSSLIGGQPGSGKSGTLSVINAQIAQLKDFAILNLDPQGVEALLFKDRASFASYGACCIPFALRAVYEEGERRLVVLQSRGLRKFTPDMWEEFPALYNMHDEAAKIFEDPDDASKPASKTENFILTRKSVAEHRKVAVFHTLATQRPDGSLFPTTLRANIQQTISHGMKNESDAEMIVGRLDGIVTHLLSAKDRGVGQISTAEEKALTKFRSGWLLNDDERVAGMQPGASLTARAIAEDFPTIEDYMEATAHLKVTLDFLENSYPLQEHMAAHEKAISAIRSA
jgi:S-DNA-T family DNA segregation ATPase FtsK/SpoIIIE